MNNEVNNDSSVTPENMNQTPVTPEGMNQTPVSGNPVESNQIPVQQVDTPNVVQPTLDMANNNDARIGLKPVQTPNGNAGNNGGVNNVLNKVKSFGVVPIVIVAVVVVALIAGVTTKIVTSTPKAVFKSQINSAFKAVNKALDEYEDFDKKFDLSSNSLLLKGSVNLDSNIKSDDVDLELLKKMTMAGELGIDIDKETLYFSGSVKGDKNTVGVSAYYQDSNAYVDATFVDDVVKVESEEIDFTEIKEALEQIKEQLDKVDTKTYNKLVKKVNTSLNKTLDSKNMKKSSGKFEVDGKTVSATKNSLVLDEEALQQMVETFCDELLEDDDFLSDFAKVAEVDKGDVKEALKDLKDSAKDVDMSDDLVVNIWTKGLLNSVVGFSLEVDEKEYFSAYQDGKKAELVIDNHEKSEYSKFKVVASFEEKQKETEFTVKYNGEKVASGTIREISDEVIDLDLSAEASGQKIKISFYLSRKEEKKSITGDYKVKVTYNDQYVGVSGDYEVATGDIPSVDTSKAVDVDDLDQEKLVESLKKVIEEDSVLKDALGSELDELEKANTPDLNSYGMSPIYGEEEGIKVLSKSQPTVLYVGSTYYSSYSELDAYNLFEALKTAQTDLKFYSYYLNYYYAEDNFKAAVKDVQYTCHTSEGDTTCEDYPAIYLIKDGKVQKAFKGTATKEELEQALKELGI